MDPDTNLAEQLALAADAIRQANEDPPVTAPNDVLATAVDLAERVVALDKWLRNGGFRPVAWARHEIGTEFVKVDTCPHDRVAWRFTGAPCVEARGTGTRLQAREAYEDVATTPETEWVSGNVWCVLCLANVRGTLAQHTDVNEDQDGSCTYCVGARYVCGTCATAINGCAHTDSQYKAHHDDGVPWADLPGLMRCPVCGPL